MSTLVLCYDSTVSIPVNGNAAVDGDQVGYYQFDTTTAGLSSLVATKPCALPNATLRPLAVGEVPGGLLTPSASLNAKVATALANGGQT